MAPFRKAAAVAAGLALVLPALAGAATSASAADKVATLDPGLTAVNLLNINDFHGRLDGGGLDGLLGKQVACTIESAKATLGDGKTALLSAGDNVGASTFASFIANDEPTIAYLNALKLQASAVGNHEFDQGFGDLTGRLTTGAKWDYLGANVYDKGSTTPALPEYKVITVNGVRVGVIGAVTQQTPMMVSPSGVLGLDFGDPVAAVNRVADKLVAGDLADIIVAEYHEGAASGTSLADQTASNPVFAHIVNDTSSKVSVIFNGHTHAVYTWDGATASGTRSVSESASYGAYVGQLQLGYDPATKTVKQYVMTNVSTSTMKTPDTTCSGDAEYTAAAQIVTDAVANAKVLGSKVIGHVSADITRAYSGGSWVGNLYTATKPDDRMRESNLGNLEAQVWLEAMNAPDKAGADIGLENPGGVRTDLKYAPSGTEAPGDVTYAEAAAINPFANTLVTETITGAQLKATLEQQWQPAGATRAFLNLGLSKNVRYTYDPAAATGSHITAIFVNDILVDPAKTYRVATNSFLAGGGDNFFALAGGTNYADSGLIDMDAFINYLSKSGTISPDFTKQSVAVVGFPSTVAYDETVTFTVEGFDLTSLASPHNTTVSATVAGLSTSTPTQLVHVDAVPTMDGTVQLTVKLSGVFPPAAGATPMLNLTFEPTGTKVSIPIPFRTVDRISGDDRYATAAAISAANFAPGVPVVYVATGVNYPDALAGAPVAGMKDAPLLLVPGDYIPSVVSAELSRLKPGKVVILGGDDVVSARVAGSLKKYTAGTVTRLSGVDRYATAAAISAANFAPGVPAVYIATGENFPDALSGAPVAGMKNSPLLLVPGDSIPAEVAAELTRLNPGKVVILGGDDVVSASVATALKGFTSGTVDRLFGADRYATSAAISAANYPAGVPVVYVATGENFPDALAGAPVAGMKDAPLLLVSHDALSAEVRAELTRLHPAKVVILGGDDVVSAAVAAELAK